VAARQRRDVAWLRDELGAVVHLDREPPGQVVLEVRRLAAVRLGERLDVLRPSPSGLEDEASDGASADVEDLCATLRELTRLVGLREGLVLAALGHRFLLVKERLPMSR
jgi:hypothetical protein